MELLLSRGLEFVTQRYGIGQKPSGADDRARTGDLDLGKVALYQLSYVRVLLMIADPVSRANRTYEGVASISAVTSSSR